MTNNSWSSELEAVSLYETDETAWLEQTAELVRANRLAEVDRESLSEYLLDMAKRDRREVYSRLILLLTHRLKWEAQPDRRSGSWRSTIREQRRELRQLLQSGTLRRHAEVVLDEAYQEARKQAADETELDETAFPIEMGRRWTNCSTTDHSLPALYAVT